MTTEAPTDPTLKQPVNQDRFIRTLAAKIRTTSGKTLLAEIAFSEEESDKLTSIIQDLVTRDGADKTTQFLIVNPPILALWLVNEAFFHFVSGAFWPRVLERIGIKDSPIYSMRLGGAFVKFLDTQQMPQFRRLRAHWSYLGPILAHAGIPRSCLPEFFEKVLPRAEEFGAAEDEAGFEQLLASLPSLYLTKTTERFLLFGEQIARDFLKRAVELRRLWFTNRTVPEPKVTGLPVRVVDAFKDWTEGRSAPAAPTRARRSLRRPVLRLDLVHGFTLELPSQRLEPGESLLRWIVEPDRGTSTSVESRSEPGERVASGDQLSLAEPFASLKVRLLSGDFELGMWVFEGISRNKPVLFFAAEDLRVISSRNLQSGLIGIAHASKWWLVGHGESKEIDPRVVESLGAMPFGWHELKAKIYDLTDLERIEFRSPDGQTPVQIQLAPVEAFRPRLRGSAGRTDSARDGATVFLGSAPFLEIWKSPHQSKAEFLNSWTLELRSADATGQPIKHVVRVGELKKEPENMDGSAWYRISTSCDELLGRQPWGEFELLAHGPMGQDARFSFRVLPDVTTTHDWSESSDHPNQVNVTIKIPLSARLRGARSTENPREYLLETYGQPVQLYLEVDGFQNRRFDLPLEVRVPLPTWALYTPNAGRPLVNWSRKPLSLSVDELAQSDAVLLAKLATPWGIPSSVTVCLTGPSGDLRRERVKVDSLGSCKVELRSYIADAQQHKLARMDVVFELELRRTVRLTCGTLHLRWAPDSFSCEIHDGTTVFRWKERVPVQNRAVKVESLLTPWENPKLLEIPDSTDAVWSAASHEVWGCPGLYRVTLGLQDPWSGNFGPAASAVTRVKVGSVSDWTRVPLFSDIGSEGYLYRILFEYYTGQSADTEPPLIESADEGRQLATRLLKTYLVVASDAGAFRFRTKLDQVLLRVPVEYLLDALAGQGEDLEPKVILWAHLFTRGSDQIQSPGITSGTRLTDIQVEALWRKWKPLGSWADFQLLYYDPGAESRLLRHLGTEQLASLIPVKAGAEVTFWSSSLQNPLKGQIRRVIMENELSPFEINRMAPGVTLELIAQFPPDLESLTITVGRDNAGHWIFKNAGSGDFPSVLKELIASDPTQVKMRISYPEVTRLDSKHPEPRVVDLIRGGNWSFLERIRAYFSQLPSSPISADAFQEACFQWCLRAASNITYRDELTYLCKKWAIPLADQIESLPFTGNRAAQWCALRELKSRWYPNARVEPLYAVNFLVWAVALAVVWRGIERSLPLPITESELADLAARIFDLMPELLDHDLMKICAIEALERASRKQPWH